MQLLAGLSLAAVISFAAHRAGSLTRAGAIAAACLGTIVFALGGWQFAVVLLAFFVTSSFLSQALGRRRRSGADRYAKGSRRDAGQVLGNGGVAALWVISHAIFPQSNWPWLGYAAALAAVTADTWATELGTLSRSEPRLITNLHQGVAPGTSGGVSVVGTAMGLMGAAAIALLAAALLPLPGKGAAWSVLAGGVAGTLFDSMLGATVQCLYFCPQDKTDTEQHPLHGCGAETVYVRGWRWLNNDWINVACGAFGSIVAVVIALVLGAR